MTDVRHEPVRVPVTAHVRLTGTHANERCIDTPRQRRRCALVLFIGYATMAVLTAIAVWRGSVLPTA